MSIKGVSPCKQWFSWIFLGKRLPRDEKYSLKCSRCNAKMEKIHKKGVIIDRCPYCKGIFLDHGEINKVVELSNNESKKKTKKSGGQNGKKKTKKQYK